MHDTRLQQTVSHAKSSEILNVIRYALSIMGSVNNNSNSGGINWKHRLLTLVLFLDNQKPV